MIFIVQSNSKPICGVYVARRRNPLATIRYRDVPGWRSAVKVSTMSVSQAAVSLIASRKMYTRCVFRPQDNLR